MAEKNNSGAYNKRYIALIVIIVMAFVLSCIRLMQYQIVDGEKYFADANQKILTSLNVTAARGEIVDRYGRPLVTNRISLNISINKAMIPREKEATSKETAAKLIQDENRIILQTTQILQGMGQTWIDDLPITKTEPYEYEQNRESDIKKLLSNLKLQEYATAQNCIDSLIKQYQIEGYNQQETRTIAGVRAGMLQDGYSSSTPYVIAKDVSAQCVSKIEELSGILLGITVSEEPVREYVSGTVAPHLIGTTGPIYAENYEELKAKGYKMNDIVGIDGIEKVMESYLKGTDGKLEVVQDKNGEIISENQAKDPLPGNTIILTIDKEFQQEVQDILANYIQALRKKSGTSNAKGGAIAVLDTKTGEALALATYPSYDINEYSSKYDELVNDPLKPTYNRVLNETYRPGSTFKTVTAIAGFCEGKINQYSKKNCTKVYNAFKGVNFTCMGNHGWIDVRNALRVSCNIFFYDVGRDLGINKIDEYAAYLGLGEKTGLEISSEKGWVASPSRKVGEAWQEGDVVQAAIGQSETYITPLQMAIQAMTIANKGTRYESHLIKSIESYDYSSTIKKTEPVIASQIENTGSAFDVVSEGMQLAAEYFSSEEKYSLKNLSYNGVKYPVALKTGSPQRTLTLFDSAAIAFAPANSPEISIAIMLEEGDNARYLVRPILDAYQKTKNQEPIPIDKKEVILP